MANTKWIALLQDNNFFNNLIKIVMKKITTIIKTMLLALVVLVMTQGCIPTTPVGGNPTPNMLTGKIKSADITLLSIGGQNNLNYNFEYDTTSAKLSVIKVVSSGFPVYTKTYTVEYLSDKVIVKDFTGISGHIYFLKPSTNLIDSIYLYDAGQKIRETVVERTPSNDLSVIYFNSDRTEKITDFQYVNGNLIAYKASMFNAMAFQTVNTSYQINYDNTKSRKPGLTFLLNRNESSLNIRDLIFDPDILGLSFGNTSTNLPLSLSWSEPVGMTGNTGSTNFINNNYSASSVVETISSTSTASVGMNFLYRLLLNAHNEYY